MLPLKGVWTLLDTGLMCFGYLTRVQNILERLHFFVVWECLGVPLNMLEEMAEEREDWTSLLRLVAHEPTPDKQ